MTDTRYIAGKLQEKKSADSSSSSSSSNPIPIPVRPRKNNQQCQQLSSSVGTTRPATYMPSSMGPASSHHNPLSSSYVSPHQLSMSLEEEITAAKLRPYSFLDELQHRKEQIKQIEVEALETYQLYKTFATLVQNQGEQIPRISKGIERTQQKVKKAHEQLAKAEEHQKRMLF